MEISIYDHNTQNLLFVTEMSKIPRKKESIAIWINGEYLVRKIIEVIYEFDTSNSFEYVQLIIKI